MVNVGAFCIDATEVSLEQYLEFVTAATQTPPEQPSACSWNTAFEPDPPNAGATELPVRGVDWCDARAYCQWAGKRLCGAIAGGPSPYDEPSGALNAWYAACSAGGTRAFPYGDEYDPQACNGGDYGAEGMSPLPGLKPGSP
jgi:formylglycine-generating enzyme required for sulfatase activity